MVYASFNFKFQRIGATDLPAFSMRWIPLIFHSWNFLGGAKFQNQNEVGRKGSKSSVHHWACHHLVYHQHWRPPPQQVPAWQLWLPIPYLPYHVPHDRLLPAQLCCHRLDVARPDAASALPIPVLQDCCFVRYFLCRWWVGMFPCFICRCRLTRRLELPRPSSRQCLPIWWLLRGRLGSPTSPFSRWSPALLPVGWVSLLSCVFFSLLWFEWIF